MINELKLKAGIADYCIFGQIFFMQKFILISSFFAITLLSSCSYYDHKTKQEFYNELAGTNDSLDRMTFDWFQGLNRAIASRNFSGLAPLRTKMGLFVSKHRAKIADIEVPPNSDGLRDSEEVFLSNQSTIITDAYPAFEPFNDITPIEDIQNQLRAVVNDQEVEAAASAALRKKLQEFARKNSLKMLQ